MEPLDQYLHQQRSGDYDSEGVFTLDPSRARDKLQHFQLPRPEFCLLKVVQAVVAWRAPRLRVWTRGTTISFEFEAPEDLGDLERWLALFLKPLEIASPAERHLVTGLLAGLNGYAELSWSYDGAGRRQTLRIDANNFAQEQSSGKGRLATVVFKGSTRPDPSVLFERCQFSPIPITVDGVCTWRAPISKGSLIMESFKPCDDGPGISARRMSPPGVLASPLAPDVAIGKKTGFWPFAKQPRVWLTQGPEWSRGEGGHCLTQCLIQLLPDYRLGDLSDVWLVVDGVSVQQLRLRLGIPVSMVADAGALTLDVSGFQAVENADLERYLEELKRSVDGMILTLLSHRDLLPNFRLLSEGGAETLPRFFGDWLLLESLHRDWPIGCFRAVPRNSLNLGEEVLLTIYQISGSESYLRSVQESAAAQGAQHRSIPTLLSHGEITGVHYTVQAPGQGQALTELTSAEETGMDVGAALGHLLELCHIVSELHGREFLCRDRLLPQNILSGGPNLLLTTRHSRLPLHQDAFHEHSQPSAELACWIAPEEVTGSVPTEASDQYLLAAIGFFLLTGRAVFAGRSFVGVVIAQVNEAVPDPRQFRPEIPEPLARALLRGLSKNPADRFATVADFRDELGRI